MSVEQATCLDTKDQRKRPKVSDKGGGDWQFINLSKSRPAEDSEFRKLVRVNAARDSWKKSKSELCRYYPKTSASDLSPASSFLPRSHATLVPIPNSEALGGQSEVWNHSLSFDENDHWPTECDHVLDAAQATCTNLPISPASSYASSSRQTKLRRLKSAFASNYPYERQLPNPSRRRLLLDNGNRDPFNAYPVQCDSQNTQLLSHCRYSHAPSSAKSLFS